MEENPFPDLKISDFEFLNALEARQKCSMCGKSRMFYCYNCFVALPSLASRIPRLKLPYKVHVIKHPGELCGKSTAIHAAVVAPEDVTIFTYPDIPEYQDNVRTMLVYPGGNAMTMSDYLQSVIGARENYRYSNRNRDDTTATKTDINEDHKQLLHNSNETKDANGVQNLADSVQSPICNTVNEIIEDRLTGKAAEEHREEMSMQHGDEYFPNSVDKERFPAICLNREDSKNSHLVDHSGFIDVVVFIDCTWFQVHKISSDPHLANLQRIELTLHETKFWRPQLDKPSTYLSTIEAIYYFAREYHESLSDVKYDGRYDNLMFFFCFFYQKIKNLSMKTGKKLKAYHQERKKRPKQQ